jgi:endonuclease G
MSINLIDLEKAAARYKDHHDALNRSDRKAVQSERAVVAERHRNNFLPAAERLLNLRSLATTTARPRAVIKLAPGPVPVPTALLTEAPLPFLIAEDGIIPEILHRDNDLRPMCFLEIAQLAARAVGRIRISDNPNIDGGDATGFLVAPGLLMTNRHVLKTADFAAAGSVIFNDEDDINGNPKETKAFRLRPDLLFVNDEILDYAIVEVASRTASGTPLSQFGYLCLFEQTGKLDPTQREAANIIQHPGGGPKKIALRDNYIEEVLPDGIDPDKKLSSLFYGTDTLKGSSGSPVCSDHWYVVALHRGGIPKTREINGKQVVLRRDGTPCITGDSENVIQYVANEGSRISRIYFSLREKSATVPDAATALERIRAVAMDPRAGPVSVRTAPILLPALPSSEEGGVEEVLRRKSQKFEGAQGYRPTFLGSKYRISLPKVTSEVKRELAPLKGSTQTELKYDHYSIKMNRERRTAFFAAGNIDGNLLWKKQGLGPLPKRPNWSWDPRMDDNFQPDDSIFSTAMQRGHLFKREDAVWGPDQPAMQRPDEHSFTITNATPMIANFNNVEWGDLEDIVSHECEAGNKVSYFAGPIFRSTDPFYNELRRDVPAAERRQGMRVPESFWKIIVWVEESKLKAAGFILNQTDEIEAQGPITEEINFGTYRGTAITGIEQATGLRFPELVKVDTYQG